MDSLPLVPPGKYCSLSCLKGLSPPKTWTESQAFCVFCSLEEDKWNLRKSTRSVCIYRSQTQCGLQISGGPKKFPRGHPDLSFLTAYLWEAGLSYMLCLNQNTATNWSKYENTAVKGICKLESKTWKRSAKMENNDTLLTLLSFKKI